ncbi:hypothetical protein B0H14DRAFT_2688386 [Mycena olivaceomarginata]|nr:hypothetical protein B0H14DRAFT_2688386 [Mycena olivaceomarginata]
MYSRYLSFVHVLSILQVFRHILQAPDFPEAKDAQGSRMGQIRWGDFERPMKRIGFEITQTAGSSVRFDPPAKSARPITPSASSRLNLDADHAKMERAMRTLD